MNNNDSTDNKSMLQIAKLVESLESAHNRESKLSKEEGSQTQKNMVKQRMATGTTPRSNGSAFKDRKWCEA